MTLQAGSFELQAAGNKGGDTSNLYVFGDHLGSAVLVQDANQHEVMRLGYSPFGQVYRKVSDNKFWKLNSGVNANNQLNQLMPYQYTGRYTEGATGYTNLDVRWYNPYTQRFNQPDYWSFNNTGLPMAVQHELLRFTGLNTAQLLADPAQQMRYGYVSGNPLSWTDPLGLRQEACAGSDDFLGTREGDYRFLTPEERTMIQNEFGASVDTSDIKIYNKNYVPEVPLSPLNNQTIAPNGNIYYGDTNKFKEDFSNGSINEKNTFIHEVTHIYQNQNGKGNLIDNKVLSLITGGSYDPNKRLERDSTGAITSEFKDFNLEQQSTLVEGRYHLNETGLPLRKVDKNGDVAIDLSNISGGELDALIPF